MLKNHHWAYMNHKFNMRAQFLMGLYLILGYALGLMGQVLFSSISSNKDHLAIDEAVEKECVDNVELMYNPQGVRAILFMMFASMTWLFCVS